MKSANPASLRKVFKVPVHDVTVVVIVTADIPASYEREFGIEIGNTQMAACGYYRRKFALFFEPKSASRLEIVNHELFHLTHRILETNHMNFDENHHEVGAYLCEYLSKKVFKILKHL